MTTLLPIIDAGLPTGIIPPFGERVGADRSNFRRRELNELQINLGKLCNQACTHCHVEAGPTKTRENMSAETADRILQLADRLDSLRVVDLTGGAPEMNPHFRRLVRHFREAGRRVIDRCNLTILSEPGHEDLADFLAEQRVDIIASLPCYLEDNVDQQRGNGVFQRSIEGLRRLNQLGFGRKDSELRLDLVFNPTGPTLPPPQADLEADYKTQLRERFQIEFHNLLTITNIPIKRYSKYLQKRGELESYLRLLADNFNPAAVPRVMCRSLLSIGWDGKIYDCDFNQMLDMPASLTASAAIVPDNVNPDNVNPARADRPSVFEIDSFDCFIDQPIATADHCYGCTAGCGSTCSGAILDD